MKFQEEDTFKHYNYREDNAKLHPCIGTKLHKG